MVKKLHTKIKFGTGFDNIKNSSLKNKTISVVRLVILELTRWKECDVCQCEMHSNGTPEDTGIGNHRLKWCESNT